MIENSILSQLYEMPFYDTINGLTPMITTGLVSYIVYVQYIVPPPAAGEDRFHRSISDQNRIQIILIGNLPNSVLKFTSDHLRGFAP